MIENQTAVHANSLDHIEASNAPVTADTPAQRIQHCLSLITDSLDDLKAKNITVLEVAHMTDLMDYIVIADGTSKRHVKALADNVASEAKKANFMPLGREGERDSEWTLVDVGSVVVHVMTPQAREFYDLEGLWSSPQVDPIVANA